MGSAACRVYKWSCLECIYQILKIYHLIKKFTGQITPWSKMGQPGKYMYFPCTNKKSIVLYYNIYLEIYY